LPSLANWRPSMPELVLRRASNNEADGEGLGVANEIPMAMGVAIINASDIAIGLYFYF